jgi:SAM-dependent MidA family methyltransferase
MQPSSQGYRSIADSDFDISAGLGRETDNSALVSLILDEIHVHGRVTFAQFMDLALYHPSEGYYSGSRERIGRGGDYVTSPEISPLFGYAVGRQLAEMWERLECPSQFTITEFGAGAGRLAQDILRWTEARTPDFYSCVVYRLVERSRSLRFALQETLGRAASRAHIEVLDSATDPAQVETPGCVLANELLDSFPVHRVVVRDGNLRELYVTAREGVLTTEEDNASTPLLEEYFARLGLLPGDGCFAEVNLGVAPWLEQAARCLGRGYLLLLDYGYEAERLYAPWRRTGTLLCYQRQEVSEDPLVRIGRQDITAHVDFTTLRASAREAGFEPLGQTDQAHFLSRLGVGGTLHAPAAGNEALPEYFARRQAIAALLDQSGLGRVGALLLGKEAPAATLRAFTSDE